jgi:hypothetical protein
MSEGMSGGTYPNRRWVEVEGDKHKVEPTQKHFDAIFAGLKTAEHYARELERERDSLSHRADWVHPDDYAILRAALEDIFDYATQEFREGERGYQFAIVARAALAAARGGDAT